MLKATSRCLLCVLIGQLIAARALAQATSGKRSAAKNQPGSPRAGSGRPAARWIGQDGRDVIGTENVAKGNEIQDMHIELSGLPANRAIEYLVVKGLGGGEWTYNGPNGPWRWAQVIRKPGSTVADLFIEPYQTETGRPLEIHYRLEGGTTVDLSIQGGMADPNLRIPGAEFKANWLGHIGADFVGRGPAVGPDGFEDATVELAGLAANAEIESVVISLGGKPVWQSGTNPNGRNDLFVARDDKKPANAKLHLAVDRELAGKRLTIAVHYKNGRKDSKTIAAGKAYQDRHMPSGGKIASVKTGIKAVWIGQDGLSPINKQADIHISLINIPPAADIVAAGLSDGVVNEYFTKVGEASRAHAEEYARPLGFVRSSPQSAELFFAPYRDESGTPMQVRLAFADGSNAVAGLKGGACDLDKLVDQPPETAIEAKPGDDLNALAERFSTIKLAPGGVYRMSRPLVLNRQARIVGDGASTLLFTQRTDDAPWSAAIKIHKSHTTLEGFRVRFSGPIRWRHDMDIWPAVIGSTDKGDSPVEDGKIAIRIRNLDLEAPPAASQWEEAPRLLRLATATAGEISGNTLAGGIVEFTNGPWLIARNNFLGALKGTYNFAVFSGRRTHDIVIKENKARQTFPGGKTWRFLVLADSSAHDLVADNDVAGIGPIDNENYPNQNSPEVILTESYRSRFEGRPKAISPDGRIVRIPPPQGDQPRAGDVVSVVSGPAAGAWSVIAAALDPATFLLLDPLPKDAKDAAVVIATGFVHETFRGNTVDCRDGMVAAPLLLAGNQYGLLVEKNHIIGKGEVFVFAAAPTESPVHWGWSHSPLFGARVIGNTFEGTIRGGRIDVEHSQAVKSTKGRTYLTMQFRDNTFVFSNDSRSVASNAEKRKPRVAYRLGSAGSLDPDELVIDESANRASVSGSAQAVVVTVESARVNGAPTTRKTLELPSADAKAGAEVKGRSRR